MKIIEVKAEDKELIELIYQNEIDCFGAQGGADMWLIMSFIRYGKLYILIDEKKNLLAVAQFQAILNKKAVFLYGFSTVKSKRGKGYGEKLLKESQNLLKDIDICEISLTVSPENKPAIKLYEKLGYKLLSYEKDEYGKGVDRYLMSKKII